ncbi:MAG: response regulator transcription factor [Bacteroidota bacterium]|nr:response regulator transcription factor [Bacteroidota bacterium]
MEQIRIMIVDDHQLVREGIESMLAGIRGIEVAALASSGEEAINIAREIDLDLVLMDITMPGMNGIEASRWLKEIDPDIRVIIVSMEISKDYVSAAIKSGVDGYLPKDVSKDVLVEAIRAAHKGKQYFYDSIKKLIFEDFYEVQKVKNPRKVLPNQLTKRENEVLTLVAKGQSNREIGECLSISIKTVETHKTHILIKLGLNNNSELIRYAVKNQIISV